MRPSSGGFDELSFTENDGADTVALDNFASEGTLFFNSISGNNVIDIKTGIQAQLEQWST